MVAVQKVAGALGLGVDPRGINQVEDDLWQPLSPEVMRARIDSYASEDGGREGLMKYFMKEFAEELKSGSGERSVVIVIGCAVFMRVSLY